MGAESERGPRTIHICTTAPNQQAYDLEMRRWLGERGYIVLAPNDAPLTDKLSAARRCDLCVLLLGSAFGPRDPASSFSYAELEASAATEDVAAGELGKLVAITDATVPGLARTEAPVEPEQRDFLRRISNFQLGAFIASCPSPADVPVALEQITERWRPPAQRRIAERLVDPAAIMISSTGDLRPERRGIRDALQSDARQSAAIPVIDYQRTPSEPVTPQDWVIESAQRCRALFLILGHRYATDTPLDGLGPTELEFVSALRAKVPIFAFIRSDAPQPDHLVASDDLDQAQFIERVEALVPPERVRRFSAHASGSEGDRHAAIAPLAAQAIEQLEREGASAPVPMPNVLAATRRRWYLRQVRRQLGTIPHLTRREGMPLDSVFISLQLEPQQRRRTSDAENPSQAFERALGSKTAVQTAQEDDRKPLAVDDALRRYPRLVVQGDPGSGKTVTLQWFAINAADRGTLPILLRLGAYALALQRADVTSLADYIQAEEQRLTLLPDGEPSEWLAALREGRALLLLDALDEVSTEPYGAAATPTTLREQVRQDVLALARAPPQQTPIVLTSRIVGGDVDLLASAFRLTRMLPLSVPQQQQLVLQWLHTAHSESPEAVLATATSVQDTLRRQTNLAEWARTPLLLTLLAALADALGPEIGAQAFTKAAIFRRALRLMLSEWGVLGARVAGSYLWQKERLLLALAQREVERGRREIITAAEVDAVWHTLPASDRVGAAPVTLIDDLSRGDGFLLPIGQGQYTFYHPMFQDYLAASWLASEDADRARARADFTRIHHLNGEWDETTQMLVSELDRLDRPQDGDAVLASLLESDTAPVPGHNWRDPVHLTLQRAARCQGARAAETARRPVASRIAEAWGNVLEAALATHPQLDWQVEEACQAFLAMGTAATHAEPYLRAAAALQYPPPAAIEAFGVCESEVTLKRLQDLLVREEGIGKPQAAALRGLARRGIEALVPVRDLLPRFVYAQRSMSADTLEHTGDLAAALLLELQPTAEELEAIKDLGGAWRQTAMWEAIHQPAPEAVKLLRDGIDRGKITIPFNPYDFDDDPYISDRLAALLAADLLGPEIAPLLDVVLYRAAHDVERNQRVAERVFIAAGEPAGAALLKAINQWNETVRERFFAPVITGLEAAPSELERRALLAQGIAAQREVEQLRYAQNRELPEFQRPRPRSEVEGLIASITTSAGEARAYFIRQIPPDDPEAVNALDTLRRLLGDEAPDAPDQRNLVTSIFYAVEKLGPTAEPLFADIAAFADRFPEYREEAMEALASLNSAEASSVAYLRRALNDENWVTQVRAIGALGKLGAAAEPVLPDLAAILHNRAAPRREHYMLRKEAVRSLAQLWPISRPYYADILAALRDDPAAGVRAEAAIALGAIGVMDLASLDALHAASHDRVSGAYQEVAEQAMRSLAALLARLDERNVEIGAGERVGAALVSEFAPNTSAPDIGTATRQPATRQAWWHRFRRPT